ncbi:hypothetical protein ACOMHN_021856 [Nucella lapillus]
MQRFEADDKYSNQDIKNNIWESIQKKMNMANVDWTEGNLAPSTQSSGEDSFTEGEGEGNTDSQHVGDDNNGENNRDNSRDNEDYEDASNSLQDAESVAADIPATDSIM